VTLDSSARSPVAGSKLTTDCRPVSASNRLPSAPSVPPRTTSSIPATSTATESAFAATLPEPSVASTVRVFEPSSRGTSATQWAKASLDVAATPFTFTLATPEASSPAVPVTRMWARSVKLVDDGKLTLACGAT